DLGGAGAPDSENVGQRDLHALFAREIDAHQTCHVAGSFWLRRSAPCPSPRLRSGGTGLRTGGWRVRNLVHVLELGVLLFRSVRSDDRCPAVLLDQPWRCLWRRLSQITMTRP